MQCIIMILHVHMYTSMGVCEHCLCVIVCVCVHACVRVCVHVCNCINVAYVNQGVLSSEIFI